jgi:sodium pump decarboxylase gamma subunit
VQALSFGAPLNVLAFFADHTNPTFLESAWLLLFGFAVVMAVLFAMMILMNLLGVFLGKKPAAAPAPVAAAAAPVAAAAVPAPAASADGALVAVITAAAHVALGSAVRVVSVQPASTEWSTQGRRDIFTSHKFR